MKRTRSFKGISNLLRRQSLLLLFGVSSTQIRSVLVAHYGKGEMITVLKRARRELEILIPQLPDTGGWRNPHTPFIISAALFLALYRALKMRGRSVDEVGDLIYEAVEKMYHSPTGAVLRFFNTIRRKLLGDRAARWLAAASQQPRYPDGFVCIFIPGDGKSFDYGFDYLECGICKFFHVQNADEVIQYMCRLDYPVAEAMGAKLIRTSTISDGSTKCDFRYQENPI